MTMLEFKPKLHNRILWKLNHEHPKPIKIMNDNPALIPIVRIDTC